MEFFGYTYCGPQNYIKDIMKIDYQEPVTKNDAKLLMEKMFFQPIDVAIKTIDCYIGRVDGFPYGSFQRFIKMKRKGLTKPVGPINIYRLPPTSSTEYGWWQNDATLTNTKWQKSFQRYPQPASPNTLILDKVRKNNKYATLF